MTRRPHAAWLASATRRADQSTLSAVSSPQLASASAPRTETCRGRPTWRTGRRRGPSSSMAATGTTMPGVTAPRCPPATAPSGSRNSVTTGAVTGASPRSCGRRASRSRSFGNARWRGLGCSPESSRRSSASLADAPAELRAHAPRAGGFAVDEEAAGRALVRHPVAVL
jgi:hypothetical protein